VTLARRLASVEAALSPTELVVRWLDEAHAYGDLVTHARAMLEAESKETPLDRLAREADAGARASAKGKRSEAINEAARTAVRETVFRFDLVLRILVVSHERLDREALVDAVLAAQLALLMSMDKKERAREPAYLRRVGLLRDLAMTRVDELRLAQQAREQVETRYLGGHPALFPEAVAAWEEQVRSAQTIAAMAVRLAELDGLQPPEPDGVNTAARMAELVADLVEPARVTALEKLGEGARAAGLAVRWLRTVLSAADDEGGSSPTG
jgi:hypothetical protein